MKSIPISLIIGFAAEAIFWFLFSLYGEVSIAGHGGGNTLGGIGFAFHLPAMMLTWGFFPSANGSITTIVCLVIGSIQFSLMALPLVAFFRRRRKMKLANSRSPQVPSADV